MPVVEHYAKQDKVFRVSGVPPPDQVFEATRHVVDPILAREVLDANQRLLDAIHSLDWEAYEQLTSPGITAIEGECGARQHTLSGAVLPCHSGLCGLCSAASSRRSNTVPLSPHDCVQTRATARSCPAWRSTATCLSCGRESGSRRWLLAAPRRCALRPPAP